MRVAAILGLGSSAKDLKPFERTSNALWQLGLPASPTDADAVLILGGDGTVHRHLPELVKLQLPVLVVPRGSGNDFARALGLRNVDDALAAWRQFSSSAQPGRSNLRRIDLGVISPASSSGTAGTGPSRPREHYFCCVGGIGLDAEIARHANRLPPFLRRRGGYPLSLLPALFGFQPLEVRVQSPNDRSEWDIDHDGPAMVVAFANTPNYGGGIRIAPGARLDDGKLEICVVEAMAKMRLLRLFPSVYSGSHLKIREVKYFQAERLRIETENPSAVYADGEYVCQTPIEVTVEPAALQVIVTRDASSLKGR
ncbi:MAG: diacylglycerol/lipid kinase family protein [Terriglobales bacterium]